MPPGFLRQKLLEGHSKELCNEIVAFIGTNKKRFRELMGFLMGNDPLLAQRAAWPFGYIGEEQPKLLEPYFENLLKMMSTDKLHPAGRRNIVRALQYAGIPEKYEGELMDTCFRFIGSPSEAPAVKAFSITILENLWKKYPEIGPELHTALSSQMEHETPAFRSRAKKLLARLG